MKVLIINSGSSSVKYQVIDTEKKDYLAKGLVESIGLERSKIKHEKKGVDKITLEKNVPDHNVAIEIVLSLLIDKEKGVLESYKDLDAVGHRLVHGGEHFNSSVLITEDVLEVMNDCIQLAPLHNPANISGIKAAKVHLPDTPMAGVFDTAFHATMPDYAYMYAIPYTLYKKHGVRRYGFHGTSHRYVSMRACQILGVDYNTQKIISCHLGNGASITAINCGKSVDTSMGFTPIEGLIMGTRAGDLDIGAVTYLMEKENIGVESASALFNKHSGMLGITSISSDSRDIEQAAENGNEMAQLAMKMYDYRIKKYIGAYMAAMNGCDILVFTGGIGENSDITRLGVCQNMQYLGLDIDSEKNKLARGTETTISTNNSKTKILVVPTDEEFMIATDTQTIIESL